MNFRNRKREIIIAIQAVVVCIVSITIMFGMVLCFA